MSQMIAYCGLVCSDCPAYIATQADDDVKRAEVATQWSRDYGADIQPEQINCDGCVSGSTRLFNHCSVCEIRKCGMERGLVNCAGCDEYACERLSKFFKMVPDAKTRLDKIRHE